MISGLDLNSTINYTLKNDKDNPTVWKLGIIPAYLFARLSAEITTDKIDVTYKVLQLSLKGWENFDVPFETKKELIYGREYDAVPIATLERIPLSVVGELAMRIMEINQITEQERKN